MSSTTKARPLVRSADCAAGDHRFVPEAESAAAAPQPGDVHRVRRQHPHDWPGHLRAGESGARNRRRSSSAFPPGCGSRCCSRILPRRWPRGAARRRPIRCGRRAATCRPRSSTPHTTAPNRQLVSACDAAKGRRRAGRSGRHDSQRRRSGRRRRLGRRKRDHRRKCPGDPRKRRRPQQRHRRHARAVRLARRARLGESGRNVSRPHDRPGRRREAAKDAERNRARYPAGRDDDHLPVRLRDAVAVLEIQRGGGRAGEPDHGHRAGRAAWCA